MRFFILVGNNILSTHFTGSELRRPLGIAIAGGLVFSQILTLYTTLKIYLYFDRISNLTSALR